MDFLAPILLALGGLLAISALIVVKSPQAKPVIDKLLPFQTIIGVAMLVVGVLWFLRSLGSLLTLLKVTPVQGMASISISVCSILLGVLFGMSQIAKWMPGSAQQGMELSSKILPYQMIIGLIGIGSAGVFLVYRLGLMTGY